MTYYETWTESAACREIDCDLWFPEKGDSNKEPLFICETACTVRLQCLDYAMRKEHGLSRGLRFGIFGGLSPGGRVKYETEWRAEQDASAA
jgi:WhiB family redox-sensing transcriptional regulator